MHTILFICTGNTCRSPMAEAVARHWLDKGLLGEDKQYFATSAGVAASEGWPPTPEAVEALADLGISHSGRSKPLTAEMIRDSSVVLCMTASHVATAKSLMNGAAEQDRKILPLDPSGGDVEDPLGMGREAYDALLQRFMNLIPERLKEVDIQ